MRVKCPHCGKPGKVRTSRDVSPLTREAYVQCVNIECGHTWKVLVTAVSTLCESLNPREGISLHVGRMNSRKEGIDTCAEFDAGVEEELRPRLQ
jgi:ssDNA-binding Zn-finger/Zn-ribbon topoisomerase 1